MNPLPVAKSLAEDRAQNLSRANEAQEMFAWAPGNEQCLSSMGATKEKFLFLTNE